MPDIPRPILNEGTSIDPKRASIGHKEKRIGIGKHLSFYRRAPVHFPQDSSGPATTVPAEPKPTDNLSLLNRCSFSAPRWRSLGGGRAGLCALAPPCSISLYQHTAQHALYSSSAPHKPRRAPQAVLQRRGARPRLSQRTDRLPAGMTLAMTALGANLKRRGSSRSPIASGTNWT